MKLRSAREAVNHGFARMIADRKMPVGFEAPTLSPTESEKDGAPRLY